MSARIAPAEPADGPALRGLLTSAALPIDDLESAPMQLWIAHEGTHVVGGIGLERYGAAGLLRSLVVATSARRRGLGRQLVAALEHDARATDVELLVLLTETAEPMFRRLGYAVVDRAYVPDDVKQSAEFRTLCPASAICMTKFLHPARV